MKARIVGFGCFAIAFSGITCAVIGVRLLDGMCGDSVMAEVPSPDERTMAAMRQGSCGATTSSTTVVYLGQDAVFSQEADARGIALSWIGDQRLLIRYSARRRIGRQLMSWRDVRIEYEGPCESQPGEDCNSDRVAR